MPGSLITPGDIAGNLQAGMHEGFNMTTLTQHARTWLHFQQTWWSLLPAPIQY
jgi:hypothetical protein